MNRNLKLILAGLAIAAVAAAILIPLARPGFTATDDGNWMVIRLTAFYQSWREGQFPVRFLGRLNFHYGYPVANFLYPGFLYIGSLIHLTGLPFTDTVELLTAVCVLAAAVALFVWLKRGFGLLPSLVGSVSYLLSPYLAYDVYKRGSIGEILAGAVAIMLVASAESGGVWMVAPLTGLLILSHNTTALMMLPVICAYLLLVRRRWYLVPHIVLGIAMSSFFWFPALYERKYVVFDATKISDPSAYFLQTAGIAVWYAGAVAALVSLVAEHTGKRVRETSFFLFVGLVAVWLSTSVSAIVWDVPAVRTAVQFPFRFLSLLWLVLPYLLARAVSVRRIPVAVLLSVLAVVPMAVYSLPIAYASSSVVQPEGFYTTNESTTTTHDEYMPRWVISKPVSHAEKQILFYQGAGTITTTSTSTQTIDARIHATEDSIVQINTVFYPGWGATLDNKPVEIAFENESGLMRIPVPKGEHHLYMAFRETFLRFAVLMLSGGAVAVWGIVAVFVPAVSALIRRRKP